LGFLLGVLGVVLSLSFTLEKWFAFGYLEASRPTIHPLDSNWILEAPMSNCASGLVYGRVDLNTSSATHIKGKKILNIDGSHAFSGSE
jgi:hypothetical protein